MTADLHFHLLPGVDDGPADLGRRRAGPGRGDGRYAGRRRHPPCPLRSRHGRRCGYRAPDLCPARRHRRPWRAAGDPLRRRARPRRGRRTRPVRGRAPRPRPGRRALAARLEAPFEGIYADFHAATGELRDRGFGVLIAHPEPSADAMLDDASGLRPELEAGSLAQVNALSLTGGRGEDARLAAWRMVGDGMAALVAADAHGPRGRRR